MEWKIIEVYGRPKGFWERAFKAWRDSDKEFVYDGDEKFTIIMDKDEVLGRGPTL